MTAKQRILYWREWAAAKRAGHLEDSDRHALHIQALGVDKSSKLFSNADFDRVLAVFRAVSTPHDLNGQLRQQDQPRIRLLWAIRRQMKLLAVLVEDPQAYLSAILRDKFQEHHIEALRAALDGDEARIGYYGDSQLDHARFTITRAVVHLRQRAGIDPSELEDLAVEGKRCATSRVCNLAPKSSKQPRASAQTSPRKTQPTCINVNREVTTEPF